MEAGASLALSGAQLGSSFSPSSNSRGGPVSSRSVFVTRLSSCSENHQQRLAVVKNGPKKLKNDVSTSRANSAILRQSDAAVSAEHCNAIARFRSIKDDHCFHHICHCQRTDQETDSGEGAALDHSAYTDESWGVQIAIAALKFYKTEISSLLPGSCRYVPTCSVYSMQAYMTYGVLKGTILTAWRLARCNPLGGNGFDPPRWFGEPKPPSI